MGLFIGANTSFTCATSAQFPNPAHTPTPRHALFPGNLHPLLDDGYSKNLIMLFLLNMDGLCVSNIWKMLCFHNICKQITLAPPPAAPSGRRRTRFPICLKASRKKKAHPDFSKSVLSSFSNNHHLIRNASYHPCRGNRPSNID